MTRPTPSPASSSAVPKLRPVSPELAAEHAALVARIAATGDRAAFRALFQHFAPRVKSYLLRLGVGDMEAEEVMQEVMLIVWRRADSFDARLASVSTWIFTIARNRRIDLARRGKRPELDPNDPALVPDEAVDGADAQYDAVQRDEKMRGALACLPPEQADLIRRAYYEDKSHSVIAAETNLPLGTVKSRIRLALGRLKDALKDIE